MLVLFYDFNVNLVFEKIIQNTNNIKDTSIFLFFSLQNWLNVSFDKHNQDLQLLN